MVAAAARVELQGDVGVYNGNEVKVYTWIVEVEVRCVCVCLSVLHAVLLRNCFAFACLLILYRCAPGNKCEVLLNVLTHTHTLHYIANTTTKHTYTLVTSI